MSYKLCRGSGSQVKPGAVSAAECTLADDDCYEHQFGFSGASSEPAARRWDSSAIYVGAAAAGAGAGAAAGQNIGSDVEPPTGHPE